VSSLFRISNLLVLPFWGLIILLPRWRWTERIMRSPLGSVAPAVLYAALVLPRLGEIFATGFAASTNCFSLPYSKCNNLAVWKTPCSRASA